MKVLELLANYYAETPKEKKKIIKFFSEYPGIGFLNVAVSWFLLLYSSPLFVLLVSIIYYPYYPNMLHKMALTF
jgi:hypothetical protein